MSVSSIPAASTASSAVSAAVLQAQATQYTNDFNALKTAIASGNVADAQKAMTAFLIPQSLPAMSDVEDSSSGFTVKPEMLSLL
jgi:uncharacterized 2Fe-2S/4Fe-4S cluster protein (DUF4445 family)